VSFHDDALMEPLRWRKPHTVFVNAMSDLAHARINDWQIARYLRLWPLHIGISSKSSPSGLAV
jgi:protein gp37